MMLNFHFLELLTSEDIDASISVFLRKNRAKDTYATTSAIDEKDLKNLLWPHNTWEASAWNILRADIIYHFDYRDRKWMREITKELVLVLLTLSQEKK